MNSNKLQYLLPANLILCLSMPLLAAFAAEPAGPAFAAEPAGPAFAAEPAGPAFPAGSGMSASDNGKYSQAAQIRPLPGALNDLPCFNSNSPELVDSEGILLSTFSPQGMKDPGAHLDFAFKGKFSYFSHHVARNQSPDDKRRLYIGLIAANSGKKSLKLKVEAAASYLSQPDAPFISLPAALENEKGDIYAGPGDRVAMEILRQRKHDLLPAEIVLAPAQKKLLLALPLPVNGLVPPLNGRSSLFEFESSGPCRLAEIALFSEGQGPPAQEEFIRCLQEGSLAGPREAPASKPGASGPFRYGRVAGVQRGTIWRCDAASQSPIALSCRTARIAFPIAALERGSFGSGQNQSAALIARYPDTAYIASGNYGVKYQIGLPLENCEKENLKVQVKIQTPLKSDLKVQELMFLKNPPARAFFRGTVCCCLSGSPNEKETCKYIHLVQKQGDEGSVLESFELNPFEKRELRVEFVYPADSTPPQVLSLEISPAAASKD